MGTCKFLLGQRTLDVQTLAASWHPHSAVGCFQAGATQLHLGGFRILRTFLSHVTGIIALRPFYAVLAGYEDEADDAGPPLDFTLPAFN